LRRCHAAASSFASGAQGSTAKGHIGLYCAFSPAAMGQVIDAIGY
jgi:hypothetical protein